MNIQLLSRAASMAVAVSMRFHEEALLLLL